MRLIEDFRDKDKVDYLIDQINQASIEQEEYRIMEVCGTHTMSISRFGLRSVLPENISLISGPGCPVCVTTQGELDAVFKLLDENDVCLLTFGDLMRVPGSNGQTLLDYRANGHDVQIVTSPLDSIKFSKATDKEVVLVGIGFETTAPTIAATIYSANEMGVENLSIIPFLKTMPEVMGLLLEDPDLNVNGFLCPGHVSAITGDEMYQPIVDSGRAAVITGFEPVDILYSILDIVAQVNMGTYSIKNLYARTVRKVGNPVALDMLYRVFRKYDAEWRGIGIVKESGLQFNETYSFFDALQKFNISPVTTQLKTGCRCGDVLKGKISPVECVLFGKSCSPDMPAGPCMVSSEGACAAYYKYS